MRFTNCTASIALVAFIATASSGCFTVNASLPGALRNDKAETEKVGTLDVETSNYFFLWGLVGSPPQDLFAQEIKHQVQAKGADGVANLTYESNFGCFDLILGSCTLGCVTPREYKLSGDIVRIKAARLPGKTSKTVSAPSGIPGQPAQQVAQGY